MELQEFLDQEENVNDEGFKIDDEQKANWALRKIKQHQEQIGENNALAQAEIDKIEAWNQQENDKAQQSIDYFQGLLAEYAMKKREEDPKFKSMKLPNGRIKFVKQQPKYVYDDEQLIDALKRLGYNDLIKTKESPDKVTLKKRFIASDGGLVDQETGELIDGVTVVDQDEKFGVEINE